MAGSDPASPRARQGGRALPDRRREAGGVTRRPGNRKKPPGARFYTELYTPQAWELFLQHLERLGTPYAVAKLDGMPSQTAFSAKMRRDADFAARADAFWRRGHRSTNRSAADWYAFLSKLDEVGAPHLVCQLPGMPSWSTFKEKRLRDPVFARHAAAVWRRHKINDRTWDALLQHLVRFSVTEACSQPGMPGPDALSRRRRIDPAFNARVVAILRDPANRHLHRLRSDERDWDEFLGALAQSRSIRAACALPGMPSDNAVRRHARADAGFQAAFADIVRQQTAARIKHHFAPGKAKRAPVPASQRCAVGKTFEAALSRDQLYAAVAAAVPKSLPPITRDDIICDMMLAVLEGQIGIHQIKASAKDFTRDHWRMFGTLRDKSLDAALFDDGVGTLGDQLAGHGADYW